MRTDHTEIVFETVSAFTSAHNRCVSFPTWGKCHFILSYFTFSDNPHLTRKVFNCSQLRLIGILFLQQSGIIIWVYEKGKEDMP